MTLRQYPGFNLTPKQRAFANHYIETGSAPEAAMRAYDCSNRNSARVMAHRNLNNAKVQDYLSSQVADTVLIDKGIKVLQESLHATKFIKLNKVYYASSRQSGSTESGGVLLQARNEPNPRHKDPRNGLSLRRRLLGDLVYAGARRQETHRKRTGKIQGS